jgi:hypothetical protein
MNDFSVEVLVGTMLVEEVEVGIALRVVVVGVEIEVVLVVLVVISDVVVVVIVVVIVELILVVAAVVGDVKIALSYIKSISILPLLSGSFFRITIAPSHKAMTNEISKTTCFILRIGIIKSKGISN